MSLLLGATDLGLSVQWRFGFIGYGERAETTPGVLYLDVGGAVKDGVLDHHAGTTEGDCTAELVFRRPEAVYNHLLGPWLRRHEDRGIPSGTEWSPILITHQNPDWDSVVAAFLAIHLIEEGNFPHYAEALANYARLVDQGRYALRLDRPESLFAPHMAYLAVQNLRGPDGRSPSSEIQLQRGLELIRRVVAHIDLAREASGAGRIRAASDFLPGRPGATAWLHDTWFDDIKCLLIAEPEKFERDKSKARLLDAVLLPAIGGGQPIEVPTFVATEPMESLLDKYWVRASGYPFFICPKGDPRSSLSDPEVGPIYSRVVLSVDPCFQRGGRRVNLRGLGFALERAETKARYLLHDGIDDRGGAPRFPDGYCANDDPWYDGRAFGWTIVDAPRSGTWLPLSDIIRIATQERFWETPVQSAVTTLLWVANSLPEDIGEFGPLPRTDGIADTLACLYEDSQQALWRWQPGAAQLPHGLSVTCTVRRFPEGTCAPLRVMRIFAPAGTTLEALVACREWIIEALCNEQPDYALARVVMGTHFSEPKHVDYLLRRLAGGEVSSISDLGEQCELVLFNNRTVVFKDAHLTATAGRTDIELEVLIYLAFLNETLIAFSRRISGLFPKEVHPLQALETETLRRDFLRFQSRYYQTEVCRTGRGRVLLEQLAGSLRVNENYLEVQSELDRLAQLENQFAEDRKAHSEKLLQAILYFVAIVGMYQTLLAFYQLYSSDRNTFFAAHLWTFVVGILAIAVGLFLWVTRRRRRSAPSRAARHNSGQRVG